MFPIITPVFAGTLLSLFVNKLGNLGNPFGWISILWLMFYSIAFLLVSSILIILFSLFSIFIIGSLAYWIGEFSKFLNKKVGTGCLALLSLIFIGVGSFLMVKFTILMWHGALGALLLLTGMIPLIYMAFNKSKRDQFIPGYVS